MRKMKNFVSIILLLAVNINLLAQSKQKKVFRVNSYRFLDTNYNKDLEPLCQGFEVIITTDKINIGDDFDLIITKSEYNSKMNFTKYWVKDKAVNDKIGYVILALDDRGENYVQVHSSGPDGELVYKGGIVFQYWDYVSNYDLWRYSRNNE